MNNQNESPFGNPRFIMAIVAVFLFLWGWQYYVNKKYPQIPAKVATKEPGTINKEESKEALIKETPLDKKQLPNIVISEEEKLTYEDEKIKWSVTSRGMGLGEVTLKTYFDKHNNPIVFSSNENLFSVFIENQIVPFTMKKISENQFEGFAKFNGKNIKRTLIYNKETMAFENEIEFESAPTLVSFTTADKKRVPESSNFLVPSFEVQNFLFKDAEKVKTQDISHVKDGEQISKTASAVSLASIGTQYFTQGFVDKSEVLPGISMNVSGQNAKLEIIYNLKDSKTSKLKSLIYIGPKSTEILKKVDPLFPEVLDLGVFGFIAKPLLTLMKFMHSIFGNWGLAIIALTLVMRFLMLPFNIVSFKSARAMQKIQPQLAAVREKYKNDPMAMNRETMALMKQHNANPLSSCLPMLVQIPIFFALWRTIGTSIEIYQQPFFGWITDLSSHDKFFVLPVLMGVTMYGQQKMTPSTMDPAQAKILNFMPILFSLFMISLPSGLTLYNFISSLFGVTQQYFLLKDNKK